MSAQHDTTRNFDLSVAHISSKYQPNLKFTGECFTGHSNRVYVAIHADDVQVCLRIPIDAEAGEIAFRGSLILRKLKTAVPNIKAPMVIETTHSYALLEYINGAPMGTWTKAKMTEIQRHKVLDGLAIFYHSMWTARTARISYWARIDYKTWLLEEVDRAILRCLKQTGGEWGDPVDFLKRRAMVDFFDIRQSENDVCLVRHGDMNACNVIIDGDELAGVIDWDTAQIVPSYAAIQHPLFIADITGWVNNGIIDGETFADDRRHLEDTIGQLCKDHLAEQSIREILATSFERQFFELSLRNRKINQEFVQRQLSIKTFSVALVETQLQLFLQQHGDMRSHSSVLDLHGRLSSLASQT